MQPIESLTIEPDEEITLEPGGYHIMLFELHELLEMGSVVSVVLTFEKAGVVDVEAIVSEQTPAGEMDVGGMSESPSS
jgi:copper(I)-binding protein